MQLEARVYKSTGSWYQVRTLDGKTHLARIRGALKLEDITSTNPISVGDRVTIEPESQNTQDAPFIITKIFERQNYVARTSPQQHRERHIVASNIDQAVVFATLRDPKTSLGFIDRFILGCETNHLPVIILLNKTDIYREKEWNNAERIHAIYQPLGYPVFNCSVLNNQGLEEIKRILKGKTTLLSGHSGVGKSSFINQLVPEFTLKTREVSNWSGKGMHTTTYAEMFDLAFDGSIVDTPGLREFGVTDIEREELSHYFPEMRQRLQSCQFNNCLHSTEPGCAILQAVKNGHIAMERYKSYQNILETVGQKRY